MRTSKSRVIIRHIFVLSFLILLGLAASGYWRWAKAASATTNEGPPSLRGEEAINHLKERGLYASLGEAVKAARSNALALPPGVDPMLTSPTRLEAGDGKAGDSFGSAVAISGDTAIVGAPYNDINGDADQGAAYIFVRSGGNWTQEARLKAPLGSAGDAFGSAVAISGDTVIVGAYLADTAANVNQGVVYVFTRSAGVWTQQAKLKADDGAANDDFGRSVAIDGDTAIIGAYFKGAGPNVDQGAAYVFNRSGGTWTQTQKLSASDAEAGDLFGISVALDAGTAVIGAVGKHDGGVANAGAAYVFTLSDGTWTERQKLSPANLEQDDYFGAAVAVSGDTALIGAFGDDIGANANQGSAYVFVRSGTVWTGQQLLTASDGSADDQFGSAVAISGDTAVIGAFGKDFDGEDQGAGYAFSRSGTTWSQQPRLFASDGEAGDMFGAAVAISGDTMLAGAPFDDVGGNANQGSAHVFQICQGLAQQQKITANNGAIYDYFGQAVAISGDTAVVGAPNDDVGGNVAQGSAYVFVRDGATWKQQQRLTATNGEAFDWLGISVAISGDTVIVGALGPNPNPGVVYVFVRNGATWTQQQMLTPSDGGFYDRFGFSVAISGDTAIVGAPDHDIGAKSDRGAAYVFVRSGATWAEQEKLTASDGSSSDEFGMAVTISGDTAVVGARLDDIGSNPDQGSAYIFARNGATWSQQQKLTASDGGPGAQFGNLVTISGDTLAVGAFNAVYAFEHSGTKWKQQQKLTASDGSSSDGFGYSVAISGDTIVVGAQYSDVGMNTEQGSAYVFVRSGETWTERQKLTASDGSSYDLFGGAVAISGNTVLVGAPNDGIGANDAQGSAYVFACADCQSITLDPSTLPNGTAGSPYNQSVTASGGAGTYNYSVSSGSLPPGLALDPTTGSLSGRPAMPGTYDFSITATDGSFCPGRRDYSLVIECPVIAVRPANPNLPAGTVGAPYSGAFTASGGLAPYSFSVIAGALPPGLTFDPATGALSGAPTVSGAFSFAVQATGSGGCSGSTAYVLTVNCPTISIRPANPNLPNGVAGAPINGAFTVTGGTAPYIFSVTKGALPAGLTLDAATGAVSGTPTVTGEFSFEVRVTDGFGCFASQQYVLTIDCPTIKVGPANSNLPNGAVGTAYNQSFSATGGVGAYAFDVAAGALPDGLTIDRSTGVLSGAPTRRNTFSFVIRATDANGCAGQRLYQIVVN
jgi:hypothetical protein